MSRHLDIPLTLICFAVGIFAPQAEGTEASVRAIPGPRFHSAAINGKNQVAGTALGREGWQLQLWLPEAEGTMAAGLHIFPFPADVSSVLVPRPTRVQLEIDFSDTGSIVIYNPSGAASFHNGEFRLLTGFPPAGKRYDLVGVLNMNSTGSIFCDPWGAPTPVPIGGNDHSWWLIQGPGVTRKEYETPFISLREIVDFRPRETLHRIRLGRGNRQGVQLALKEILIRASESNPATIQQTVEWGLWDGEFRSVLGPVSIGSLTRKLYDINDKGEVLLGGGPDGAVSVMVKGSRLDINWSTPRKVDGLNLASHAFGSYRLSENGEIYWEHGGTVGPGDAEYYSISEKAAVNVTKLTEGKAEKALWIHDISANGCIVADGTNAEGAPATLLLKPFSLTVNVTTDGDDPDPHDDVLDSDPDLEGIQVSLRAAIQAVNADKGASIKFGILGQGTPVIRLTKALPVVNRPAKIDGTSQTGGFVEIDGNGLNAAGLNLQAGKTEVRGLIFHGFNGSEGTGIRIAGDGENLVAGNYFGVDASGNIPKPLSRGILIERSSSNLVGGAAAADQNIIWATDIGLRIQGAGSHGNRIVGNRVGLGKNGESLINSAGTRFISGIGLYIAQGDRNEIGGPGALGNAIAGDVAILVGSRQDHLISDTRIEGNRIGLISSGATVAGGEYGVALATLNSSDTRAIVSRTQIVNNRIAGHLWLDVWAFGKGVVGTTISGNTIGLRFDGAAGLPDAPAEARTYGGVRLDGAPSTTIRGNTVAGQKWNLMVAGQPMLNGSPWEVGHELLDPGSPGDEDPGNSGNSLIEGNTVGMDAGGVVPAGAVQSAGISLFGYPRTITVKDNTVAGPAICLWLDEGDGHTVAGNRLGTPDGQDRGSLTGILVVDALKLTVGPGNVIGRCAEAGLKVDGQATDIRVLRNKIGTDPAGRVAWPNTVGIVLKDAELSQTESLLVEGNLISGNATVGVLLDFAVATAEPVQIVDNRIGVDETGKALPNNVGVRVKKGNARLTGDTIAHNLSGGLGVIDPASTVSVTRSPFFANGLEPGLGPLGIIHATQPFHPPMQLAALKSAPDASGQVSMVFALPKLGASTNGGLPAAPGEKVTIEFYANDGLTESQGRYPLFVREIDPTKAWSERFVVSPSSLMATKATFTVTLTRRGQTSEFSSSAVREPFVWPELHIGPSKPGEITLAWSAGGKPGLFVVEESSLLDSGATFVLREVTPKVVNGVMVATIPVSEDDRFFRLVMNPEALFR